MHTAAQFLLKPLPQQHQPSGHPIATVTSAQASTRAGAHAGGFVAARPANFSQPRSRSQQWRRGTGRGRRQRLFTVGAAGPGGGVLDRPTTAKPGIGEKSTTKKKRPPIYRVMLHNDSFNRREYVVQILLKVIDGLTMDDAVNVMQKAHIDGLACVITCPQEDAETYCEGLRGNGLIASVEPDT